MDLIGIDINYQVSNMVWDALGKPAVATGCYSKRKIGKENSEKTGEGFYQY